MKILVAADNKSPLYNIYTLLETLGYDVTAVCPTAKDATVNLCYSTADILLADPFSLKDDLTCYLTCVHFRNENLKILLCSHKASKWNTSVLSGFGVCEFIRLPISSKALINKITFYLSRKSSINPKSPFCFEHSREVYNAVCSLGFDICSKGTSYLMFVMTEVIKNHLCCELTPIYEKLAACIFTSPKSVEAGISLAVKKALSSKELNINSGFSDKRLSFIKSAPSAKTFIFETCAYILMNIEEDPFGELEQKSA